MHEIISPMQKMEAATLAAGTIFRSIVDVKAVTLSLPYIRVISLR